MLELSRCEILDRFKKSIAEGEHPARRRRGNRHHREIV